MTLKHWGNFSVSPYALEPTVFLIINYCESPGHRIRGYPKTCKGCISLPHPAQKNAKLFGLSWFNLGSVVKQDTSEC